MGHKFRCDTPIALFAIGASFIAAAFLVVTVIGVELFRSIKGEINVQ